MYDMHMHLKSFSAIISDGSKYIAIFKNINTKKKTYCMCI
jgi:hypothetical protein